MKKNLSNIAWREAATGGLFLGLALCAVEALTYMLRLHHAELNWVSGLLNFALLGGFIWVYGRRMGDHYGASGYTFTQSVGFTLQLMLFAGAMAGFGLFILQNYVDPDYYGVLLRQNFEQAGLSAEQTSAAVDLLNLKTPVLMVVSSMFGMLLYGGLIGMVLSAFLKRLPAPSGGTTPDNPGQQPSANN